MTEIRNKSGGRPDRETKAGSQYEVDGTSILRYQEASRRIRFAC